MVLGPQITRSSSFNYTLGLPRKKGASKFGNVGDPEQILGEFNKS